MFYDEVGAAHSLLFNTVCRSTLIYAYMIMSNNLIIHFSDVTLLFEQWIIFKNLQFILLFLNI
jgi:hypothetical protein